MDVLSRAQPYVTTYRNLRYTISLLRNVPQQVSQEQIATKNEKDRYTRSNQFLNQTRKLIEKKRKEMKNLRSVSVTSIFAKVSGQHASKLKKSEEELKDLLDRELKSSEGTRKLQENYNKRAKKLGQLQEQKKEYDQVAGQLRQLLTNVFSGPIEMNPREYQLETELNQRTVRLKQLQGSSQRYHTCGPYLNQALKSLNQALSSLGGANDMATLDIFMSNRRGFNSFVDVAKHQKVGNAKQYVQNANLNLQQARQVIPNLPYIQSSQVGTTSGEMFVDIVFDNVFTDIMMKQKIQKMRNSVIKHRERVNQVVAWINQQIATHNQATKNEHTLVLTTERNLLNERIMMMDQIINQHPSIGGGGRIVTASSQQPQQQPVVPIVPTISQHHHHHHQQQQQQFRMMENRVVPDQLPMMTPVVGNGMKKREEEEEEEQQRNAFVSYEIPTNPGGGGGGGREIQHVEYNSSSNRMNNNNNIGYQQQHTIYPRKEEEEYAPSAPPVFKPYE